ncbi:MAG: OmpA family protein [Gammaproteobacteria bacterium]|nr:OmpA family protein [Gammaproteobacteria bacterium]
MVDDDPFAAPQNSDRTIIKPKPGGRGGSRPAAARPQTAAPTPAAGPAPTGAAESLEVPGLNPLVGAAGELLQLASQLRNTARHADPAGLSHHVMAELKRFEEQARAGGATPETTNSARYCLCAFLDEVVLNTPWGAQSAWAQSTLLSQVYNDTWGGEKVFDILDRLMQDPHNNLDLLELLYMILTLGFEGKYKLQQGKGRAALEQIQADLYRTVRNLRGEPERELAPNWRGIGDLRNPLSRFVPLWVVAAVALALMLTVFLGLKFSLGKDAEPAQSVLRMVGRDATPVETRPAVAQPTANLSALLAADIQAGRVDVVDVPGKSTVTVLGQVYRSGSANINSDVQPVLGRIADALNMERGRVRVLGHTDSDPIPASLRLKFADNWALSERRAESVMAALVSAGVDDRRVDAEGLADTVPLVENNSAANKARNRRVEIVLIPTIDRF